MFQIEKTRVSKSIMLEHYFFINRKRTNNIANKALDLFILESLFIKIVEAILHPSTTYHLSCTLALKLTTRIKEGDTTIRIFRKFAYR